MSLKSKIAFNTGIQVISKVVATALGLVALGIMTRYLGQSGFGEYTTIITFISFFAVIADLGLTLVTVQIISAPGADENKALNNLFSLRLISALFFIALGPITVLFFPYGHDIKIGVLIVSLAFVFIALNQVLVGLFQKKLRMEKVSIAEVAGRTLLLVGVIIAAEKNWGINGILWATVVGNALNFLLHYLFSRKFVKLRLAYDKKFWLDVAKRSWPLALIIFFNLIYLRTDTLILSLVKTQAEVGLYGSAYKVIDVLITIPFMFAGIVLPVLTNNWGRNNKSTFNSVLQKSFDFMAMIALPLAVGTMFTANEIMTIVAGPDFLLAGTILRILIIAAAMIFIGAMFSHAIIAVNKQKKLIGLYIFTSITSLIAYLIFIPKFSYIGAAAVTVYSETIIALVSIFYAWKFTSFLPQIKTLAKIALASLVMALFLFSADSFLHSSSLNLAVTIIVAALVYTGTLLVLKAVSKKDLKEILNH